MSIDTLHGFPPGYFLIRATHSYHHHRDRHMQLDVAHSEKRPGVELVLRTDNTHDPSFRHHIKHAFDHLHGDDFDSQVFFMSTDGVLRSESSGHPIGCEIDQGNGMLGLVVQSPRPYDHSQPVPYRFEYDKESGTITARPLHDICESPQSQKGPYAAQSSETVNSSDSGVFIAISPVDSSLAHADQPHLLEFVPRTHRHSSFSRAFDRLLESPTEEASSSLVVPFGQSRSQDQVPNNSWNENRTVRLVRGRKRRATATQKWEIVPVYRHSCEVTSKAWSVISNESPCS